MKYVIKKRHSWITMKNRNLHTKHFQGILGYRDCCKGTPQIQRYVTETLLADLIGVNWVLPGHMEHVSDFLCQSNAGAAVSCDVDSRDAAVSCHL